MIHGKDLMIGDWISYGGKPVQVLQLSRTEYKGFEPIPLTPEILAKNATESNKNMFGGMNYALDADYFIEDRGHRFCLSRIMAGHKYSTFWICDIHYVHQLQHALKLCGIEKEIVV